MISLSNNSILEVSIFVHRPILRLLKLDIALGIPALSNKTQENERAL